MKTKFCCTVRMENIINYDLKIAKENFHVKKQIRKLKAEVEKTQSVYG